MVEEAPWRKRSRSEDRRPGQLPVKKDEPAWKQNLKLLKKPKLKAEESAKISPAWKSGAEMLRKSSPNRRTSLVDTVPPLASRASMDIPWKSGVQLLKKTSRENSPTKTDLPEIPQDVNVPWKIGVQMLKKTSKDNSPAAPCQSEAPSQLGVPWKSVRLRKTSGSRDGSPEKRDSNSQLLEVIEWKAGKEMLRKGSPTPVETQVPGVHKDVNKKESAKTFLTQMLATVAKEQEANLEGTLRKSSNNMKPIPIKKVVKVEPIPHVELKPTPQKSKPEEKALTQTVLKKVPSQLKMTSSDSSAVLKRIGTEEKLVGQKSELKPTSKKAKQIETFGKVELKRTPQKAIEITTLDQRVELKPIPQKAKIEESKQFEYQAEKFSHESSDIPDGSKTVLQSSPVELPVEISSTELLVVKPKTKPTILPKPKESATRTAITKPTIAQKPNILPPEERRERSSVSLERKSDAYKEVILVNQTEETFEIQLENKGETLKATDVAEQVTLKQLPKSQGAIVTELVPEIQLKKKPQSPGRKKVESSRVELKKVVRTDLTPSTLSKKEKTKEELFQINLKPVAKLVSASDQVLQPPSESLQHQLGDIIPEPTIAEVKKPLEPAPVDKEPEKVVTPWRTKKTLEPTPAKVEIPAKSTAYPSDSIKTEANLPSSAVELSALEVKEKRVKTDEPEEVPEVVLKRTPQKINQEETVHESIQLKKVPKKSKDLDDQTVSLKPIHRREEAIEAAEVVLKRTPQKAQPEVVESTAIQLKKVAEKPKEIPQRAEIRLKPVVRRHDEDEHRLQPEEVDVGSIQHDAIPQQTKGSITLVKSSLDQSNQIRSPVGKDECNIATPAQVTLPDSVREAPEAKREVPWRKKIAPSVPHLPRDKEKIDLVPVTVSKPDKTLETSIPTFIPETLPGKIEDVLVDTKITLKRPITPQRKTGSEIVPEAVREEMPKTQKTEEVESVRIPFSKVKEISPIPQLSKFVKHSPREQELQAPHQVMLKRTPQKAKVEAPEPEMIKLKKVPQREVPNATMESQATIATSTCVVPQMITEISEGATILLKPFTELREVEPEVVAEILPESALETSVPEEVKSVGIEKVIDEVKESPKISLSSNPVKRSPQQPEVVSIPQQVVLKRTPQRPKEDEPEREIIQLKKIPRQEVYSITSTPDLELQSEFHNKVPFTRTEIVFNPMPSSLPAQNTETTEMDIELIPEEKKPEPELPAIAEAIIDIAWRKPRLPSTTPEQPIEEKPLQPEAELKIEPGSLPLVPETASAGDQPSSSATSRLKRIQRKYIPDISETASMQIQQDELKLVAAVLDEPTTITLTASATTVQLKRPNVPVVPVDTSPSKTEEQIVKSRVVMDQAVSITATKISKTSHETEIIQSPGLEEKSRLPKIKASITLTPKCQPPAFTKKLQPLSSRTGKKVRLHCQFQGEPQPTITWYRNESVLLPTADRLGITTEPTSSVLEISQVVLEDTGIYTCRAVNEAGSAITSANFIVQG